MHKLDELAEKCAGLQRSVFRFEVVELWAFGDVLGAPRDLDVVQIALVADLPVDEVPWRTEPAGGEHWANSTRLSREPIDYRWRSVGAPVWNHEIVRPALFWSAADGVREEALIAMRDGVGELVRVAEPSADELRKRVDDELGVSFAAVRRANEAYADRRWAPGKLTPHSDALAQAVTGYLDLLDAQAALSE